MLKDVCMCKRGGGNPVFGRILGPGFRFRWNERRLIRRRRKSEISLALSMPASLASIITKLLDLLARIDAPEPLLCHPAIETSAEDAAPRSGAALHRAEHAALQLRDHLGACVRLR